MRDEFTSERAKQFSPFSALNGLEAALYEKTFRPEWKTILGEDAAEELNQKLCSLTAGDYVCCSYYKAGRREYVEGIIDKIYDYERQLKISGKKVSIDSILNIIIK